jgi:hypothetical protein
MTESIVRRRVAPRPGGLNDASCAEWRAVPEGEVRQHGTPFSTWFPTIRSRWKNDPILYQSHA